MRYFRLSFNLKRYTDMLVKRVHEIQYHRKLKQALQNRDRIAHDFLQGIAFHTHVLGVVQILERLYMEVIPKR
jgi:hypothetical protein